MSEGRGVGRRITRARTRTVPSSGIPNPGESTLLYWRLRAAGLFAYCGGFKVIPTAKLWNAVRSGGRDDDAPQLEKKRGNILAIASTSRRRSHAAYQLIVIYGSSIGCSSYEDLQINRRGGGAGKCERNDFFFLLFLGKARIKDVCC